MSKRLLILSLLFAYAHFSHGQIVYTDPAIPTMGKPIKIYFNSAVADQGNLHNYTGDVYVHTGVTVGGVRWKNVKGTWGNNTTQPKLNKIDTYLYELDITSDIKTFYGLSASEVATEICLVFRSADASKQTKPDLFIQVYQLTLNTSFIIPDKSSFIVSLNTEIPIKAAATLADSVSLYLNNTFIKSGKTADLVTDTITADQYGEFWVKAIAWDKPSFAVDSFFFFVRKTLVTEELPSGLKDGINYTSNTSVTLVLHAPYFNYAFVTGDFTDWLACEDGYMKRTPDAERYWIEINDLIPGKEYRFQYLVDSSIIIADPYADKILDPWNDSYITSSTYPGLINYPTDKASGIVSVLQTAQVPYTWQVTDFQPTQKSDLVIYELLIRDFLALHDFKTLIDTLSYLDDLGVNAIELMPVNEFEGNSSWGYNPVFYFAPDKYYGPKNDMKAFIDSCHARGIAVIMDIVLNHNAGQSPFILLYLDHYGTDQTYMKVPNPWFNASSPNNVFKWGADFNHESISTQILVDRINAYWLTEYNIDGFRFDFTKGFTNTVGDGSAYDASRIAILERMADEIWSVKPEAYIILEHFGANAEEIELANYGMMLWGNNNYNFTEAAMGYTSDLSYASYLGRGWSVPHLVSYMESHDEERLMYKTITYGNATGDYDTKNQTIALKRMRLDALFFLSVPGPKMIWQFGELGYDVSIDYGGRTSEKPIRWEYFSNVDRHRLFATYKVLINLRKTQPVFGTDDFSWSLSSTGKRFQLNSTDMKVNILGNFGVSSITIDPAFQQTGKWYEFFTDDSITVTNVSANFNFKPGEYRLYSTKKLPSPKLLLGINDHVLPVEDDFVTVYPNPSQGEFNIEIRNLVPAPVTIKIFDISGRSVREIKASFVEGSQPLKWDGKTSNGSDASPGFYIVQVRSGYRTETEKIIKN